MSATNPAVWSATGPLTVQPPGTECQCSARHSPAPVVLEYHHIWPQEFDGPTVPENRVWICATTHNTVHAYLRLFVAADAVLPRAQLRIALGHHHYPLIINHYAFELARMGFMRIKAGAITPENTWEPTR
jgi:hypothetical protein